MHARIEFDFQTTASPDQVVELLTDFSPERPKLWPGLAEKWYEVYELGATSADVREGQDKPTMWARERYEWTSDTVTWTVVESSDLAPGSYVSITARPSPTGGSDVHGIWERSSETLKGRIIIVMMRVIGPKVLRDYLRKVYDGLAKPT